MGNLWLPLNGLSPGAKSVYPAPNCIVALGCIKLTEYS